MSGRFVKGQSGNPSGRPKARRPHVSAFEIILEKTLSVTQGGVERELTIDEALQLQTYRAALKGSRMAIRAVLKMIEKRELALAKKNQKMGSPGMCRIQTEWSTDNADEALNLLGIISIGKSETEQTYNQFKIETWAAQAALSRPGRCGEGRPRIVDIDAMVHEPKTLRWAGRDHQ